MGVLIEAVFWTVLFGFFGLLIVNVAIWLVGDTYKTWVITKAQIDELKKRRTDK